MKILIIGRIYPDSFAKNIFVTLNHMGHEVFYVEHALSHTEKISILRLNYYASALFPKLEEYWFHAALRQAKAYQVDLIISVGVQMPPQIVNNLKKSTKATCVIWFPDAMVNFGRQYILASNYDAFFFKDRYIVEFFRDKLRKRAFFLPEAFNPLWHKKVNLTEEDKIFYGCDLTLAGNMHYYRALICERFLNYNFKIWGVNYPRWLESPVKKIYQNHFVAEEEKAKAFNAAKIVLNMMHYSEILGINTRAFEAAGCGAFQILDWKPNLHEFFEPEKEVVTFHTICELEEKVRYYLDHDSERKEISDRAYERAHREHTFKQRLTKLLSLAFGGKNDE